MFILKLFFSFTQNNLHTTNYQITAQLHQSKSEIIIEIR